MNTEKKFYHNYDFNINSIKLPNLPDPTGFNITYTDLTESRQKIKNVAIVKTDVSFLL